MLSVRAHSVWNMENALRGARNPFNSWSKIDSYTDADGHFILGEADRALAMKLCRAGSDHRKFMRQIFVSADICAPLYWWKEFDTYKVGTTANSTSTMHTIHTKSFSRQDFSLEQLNDTSLAFMDGVLSFLETQRLKYIETKDKTYWWQIIQTLPSSFNQLRTCTFSYENLVNMYAARRNHKLDEWLVFCGWIEELPYANDLICFSKTD